MHKWIHQENIINEHSKHWLCNFISTCVSLFNVILWGNINFLGTKIKNNFLLTNFSYVKIFKTKHCERCEILTSTQENPLNKS